MMLKHIDEQNDQMIVLDCRTEDQMSYCDAEQYKMLQQMMKNKNNEKKKPLREKSHYGEIKEKERGI